jgi:acid phosphatase type 7
MWKRLCVVFTLTVACLVAPSVAEAAPCTVAAVGDVAGANDYQTGANRTGRQIQNAAPVALLALGDLAYEDGLLSEFRSYYDPGYGPLKPITRPVPGNHEYHSGGAGYRSYFNISGANYAFNVCGWRVIAINQYAGISAGATFIRNQGAANPGRPILVMWHEPRWSSGRHGPDLGVQPLWAAAVAVGARVVLDGHEHNYERFAPMNALGARTTPATGTIEFVSGLGGHEPRAFAAVQPNSVARVTGVPGVLYLTLNADSSFSWRFRTIDGVVQDRGGYGPR